MKRRITQTRIFEKSVRELIAKRKLSEIDFEEFKSNLVKNPNEGDVIPGTAGIRKTRLKSISKGKRGGFRVCYLDLEEELVLFLVFIYPKNVQENLTSAEKKDLKKLCEAIRNAFKKGVVYE